VKTVVKHVYFEEVSILPHEAKALLKRFCLQPKKLVEIVT